MLQLATLALSTPMLAVVIVAAVLVLANVLYGVLKKFSRVSWVGWQIPIVFGICLLVMKFVPLPEGIVGYGVMAGVLFAVTALVLGVGAIIRSLIWHRTEKAHIFFRVFDRILGIITAILNWVVVLAIFGAFVLWLVNALMGAEALPMLSVVYDSAIWGKVGEYALDLEFITLLIFALKAGYRLGIGRFLWAAFTLVLTFFALFGSLYLVLTTPALQSFAHTLGGAVASLGNGASTILGYVFAMLILFLAFFVVIILVSILINFIFKQVNKVRWLNVFSGLVMGTVFFLVTLVFLLGIGIGVHQLALLASQEGSIIAQYGGEVVAEYLMRLEEAISASHIAGFFYQIDLSALLG